MPQAAFQVASVTALPFADDRFEHVLCTEVIEHVANPQQAVGELLRILRPGGRLVLTTPNRVFKPMFDLLSLTGIRPYHGYENWLFTWQLRREIEKLGGRIVKTHCFNFFYPCRPLDFFERFALHGNLMINQGYLITI